jgi:hypothetical protein
MDRVHALRGGDDKLRHYPYEIRKQIRNLPEASIREDWLNHLPCSGWSPGQGPRLRSWPIPLATYSLSGDELDWQGREEDVEDTFARHRFIWLLRWLSLRPTKEDLEIADSIILDWIEKVGHLRTSTEWETYSVSERVVNWLLYLCATKSYVTRDPRTSSVISEALREHLRHITNHLEYYGKVCNNHILNDARALYIGGRLMQLSRIADLGRELFQRHTPELIDEKGVVLESSSHYQLLLTRTLVEVLWAARTTGDTEFSRFLDHSVPRMINQCLYLGGVNKHFAESFPRIGDVSPDFPVSWFYPDKRSNQDGENWWGLWDAATISSVINLTELSDCAKEEGSEWKFVSDPSGVYTVIVHMPHSATVYPRGHGHLDFGGFLLYDADGPLLVDRGRYSYRSDARGTFGLTARAHNTSLINGLTLLPGSQGIFRAYREFLKDGERFGISSDADGTNLSWRTGATSRLAQSLKWNRNLSLKPEGIQISETISNPDGIGLTIESYLHLAPGWELCGDSPTGSRRSFAIAKDGKRYQVATKYSGSEDYQVEWFKGSEVSPLGWHFPEYGRQVPALTMQLSLQATQDSTLDINLRPL